MGNFLKNVLLSAAFVVVGTMATSAVAAVAAVFLSAREAMSPITGEYAVYGAYAATIMGALFGFFFSVASLFIAAVTMPLAIGLIRVLKLPRPLFDMLGGGATALVCTAVAVGLFESLARAKGGSPPEGDVRLIIDICGMIGGAAIGYVRYAVLAPKGETPKAPLAPHPAGWTLGG